MDPKKQDLNPELKQIYDRVMNTQVAKPPTPTNTPQPPTGQSANIPEATVSATGAAPQPANPVAPAVPQPVANQAAAPQKPGDPFLATAAPRPSAPTSSFAFSGNKVTTPQPNATTHASKSSITGKIIAVLVVVLLGAWGGLWAKIFGLF